MCLLIFAREVSHTSDPFTWQEAGWAPEQVQMLRRNRLKSLSCPANRGRTPADHYIQ